MARVKLLTKPSHENARNSTRCEFLAFLMPPLSTRRRGTRARAVTWPLYNRLQLPMSVALQLPGPGRGANARAFFLSFNSPSAFFSLVAARSRMVLWCAAVVLVFVFVFSSPCRWLLSSSSPFTSPCRLAVAFTFADFAVHFAVPGGRWLSSSSSSLYFFSRKTRRWVPRSAIVTQSACVR